VLPNGLSCLPYGGYKVVQLQRDQQQETKMFVLMETDNDNAYLAVYGPAVCHPKTIGCTGKGGSRGHFSHDLAAVGKFEAREDATAFLRGMQDYDREIFRRENWRIVPYEVFEQQVLKTYLKRPLKERSNMTLFLDVTP
jgi:hypothetical protein